MNRTGKVLLEVIARNCPIKPSTNFYDLHAVLRDKLVKEYLILCPEAAEETVPGHNQFGPLTKEFSVSPAHYLNALGIRMNNSDFTDEEKADLIQTESVGNAECLRHRGKNLYEYFQADRLGFYEFAVDMAGIYLSEQIEEHIQKAVQAHFMCMDEWAEAEFA